MRDAGCRGSVFGFTCSKCGLRLLFCGQLHQCSSPGPRGDPLSPLSLFHLFLLLFSELPAAGSSSWRLFVGPLQALFLLCEFSARLVTLRGRWRAAASSSLQALLPHNSFSTAFPRQPPRTLKCPSLSHCLPCQVEREAVSKTQPFSQAF